MSAVPSAQLEAVRRRLEIAEERRDAARHQVQEAQLQLQASERQLEFDEAEFEAARAQLRVEELRMPENSSSGHGNNSQAPTATATPAPVGGLRGYGHRRNRGRGRSDSRSGRGGKDSRSSTANNVGMSGRGTFPGVSKNTANPNPRTAIPPVPEVEEHDRADGSGRTSIQVSNSSYRYNFAAATASTPARVSASTTDWQHGNEIMQRALQDLGSGVLNFEFKPWQQPQLPFVKGKATGTRVIKSTGRNEQKALERGVELLSVRHGSCCINCEEDHVVKDCLFAPRGSIPGCTLCNSPGHLVDTCDKFKEMSIEKKAELLVYERGNRPMLETSKDKPEWHWYLREYLKDAGQDVAVPKAFPWTSAFAKEVQKRPDFIEIQAQWDADKNIDSLPKDPAHGSFDAVRQLYWSDRI
ncbi:hypothetical protein NW752_006896 [Fusarium irregulare]|uniref:CCHC-type domain-containing protein n=1 Tax=Fusarium irregulare TaxID=2494466 RepID=A0A9W8PSR8_9HYPO|nr:hypothetical protein NW766_005775 [Fusarium irregulare]KAJ4015963.1 hypothetical protein NW752_006896 [Fusarium irregulare]